MSNLLSKEPSLYLRQHADQPVEWMPWGSKAFDQAVDEDKPILLSIGYSSCHWCQAMSRECFEDEYVASIMNRHFVCVKVDREERPDIDQTYIEAIRMFDQSAGWPMNVFCLPDGRPFWGGTYFPKEDNGQGIVPWPQLLMRISEHYRREKDELLENAEGVIGNLEHSNYADCSTPSDWKNSLLLDAAKAICASHDDAQGGFSKPPKFPSPMKIEFLLAIGESHSVRSNPNLSERIDFCVTQTVEAMARGGLFDQVGGGFFRYVIDDKWEVPHFDKMLCDNALLLSCFSRAHRKKKSPLLRRTIEKTIDWLLREMGNSSTGFSSSLSADSEGKEGGYYLWNSSELVRILGKTQAGLLGSTRDEETKGDFLPSLSTTQSFSPEVEECFAKLLHARKERKGVVSRDEKRITAWNALLLKGLVDASIALQRKEWLTMAVDLANWMKSKLLDQNGEISSIHYEGQVVFIPGFLDDYAFLAEALLNLSSVSEWFLKDSSLSYIEDARNLASKVMVKFHDEKGAGYFFSSSSLECPGPAKKKFWYDNAIPSGNSSMLRVFTTLHFLTGEKAWLDAYLQARAAYPNLTTKAPQGIGHALSAITENEIGLGVIKSKSEEVDQLVESLSEKAYRPIFIRPQTDSENKLELQIGERNLPTFESTEELLKVLYEE